MIQRCSRCGIGIDDDGDGDCQVCGEMTDAEVVVLKQSAFAKLDGPIETCPLFMQKYPLAAIWTNDCQGKKDYDGVIVEISTRYWPRGGGFYISGPNIPFHLSEDPEIKPSAKCDLDIRYGDPEGGGDRICLNSFEVEGESFEEIAPQVEKWAQEQMNRVISLLIREYTVIENK